MIQDIDFLTRLITIGAGLMLIAQFVAGEVRDAIKAPLVAMIVGVIFYLINATPVLADSALDPWIDLLSISVPFSIWLFARNLFERAPDRRIMLAAALALLLGWFLAYFLPMTWPLGFFWIHLAALVLIGDLLRVGVFEREDDLVEQRRTVRLWLPLLVAAQAGGVLIFEMFEAITGSRGGYPIMQLINTLLILALMLFAGLALLRTDPQMLVETEEDAPHTDEPLRLDLSPSETVLHDRLIAAMAAGAYREPGLTITGLAQQLDTPEHRLRLLINRRLGYRNFSAFLNRYRINEAREKLSSRDEVDLPVLTIAMDLGYNSLPTFNRAFRAETGTTPSDFRRTVLAESTPFDAGQN